MNEEIIKALIDGLNRERKHQNILDLQCQGKTDSEIAEELGIHVNTLYQQKKQIETAFEAIGAKYDLQYASPEICKVLREQFEAEPDYSPRTPPIDFQDLQPPDDTQSAIWRALAIGASVLALIGLIGWLSSSLAEPVFQTVAGAVTQPSEVVVTRIVVATPPNAATVDSQLIAEKVAETVAAIPPVLEPSLGEGEAAAATADPNTIVETVRAMVNSTVNAMPTQTAVVRQVPAEAARQTEAPLATEVPVTVAVISEPTATPTSEATLFPAQFTITEDFNEGEKGVDPAIKIGGDPLFIDGRVRVRPGNELTIQVGELDWRNYTITFNVSCHSGWTSHVRVRKTDSDNFAFFNYNCSEGQWWVRDAGQDFMVEDSRVSRNSNDPIQILVEDNILRFNDERDIINTIHERGRIELFTNHGEAWIDNLTITRND